MDFINDPYSDCSDSDFKSCVVGRQLEVLDSFIRCLTLEKRKTLASANMKNTVIVNHLCKRESQNILQYILIECGVGFTDISLAKEVILTAIRAGAFLPIITLDKFGILKDLFNDDNEINILFEACFSKNFLLAKYLQLNGFNINCSANVNLCSTDHEHFQMALRLGTDLDYPNIYGRTIFMNASANGEVQVINSLLKLNFDVYKRDYDGANALCWLYMHNQRSLLRIIPMHLYPLEEQAAALEYCGARSIIFESRINNGLSYWKESLQIRHTFSKFPVEKIPFRNEKMFINLGIEFQTQYDLYRLKFDIKGAYFQALLVFLRILEWDFPIVPCAFAEAAEADCFRNHWHISVMLITQIFEFPSCKHQEICVILKAMKSINFIFERDLRHLDTRDSNTALQHLTLFVDMLSNTIFPILESCSSFNPGMLENYKSHLEIVARYISVIINNEKKIDWLRSRVEIIAAKYFETFPTSLLHVAIEKELPLSVIHFIIDCGADIKLRDIDNYTVLDYMRNKSLYNLF